MFKQNRLISGSLFFLITLITLLAVNPVYACSPAPQAFDFTIEDRIENAPLVLVGTVIGGETRFRDVLIEVEVEVDAYLKGQGLEQVTIHGFGDGADCLSVVEIGATYVFFAEGKMGERLTAEYLGVHDAAYFADDDLITRVVDTTGQIADPVPLPLIDQIWLFFEAYRIYLIGLGMIALVIGMVLYIKPRFISRRKSKAKRG